MSEKGRRGVWILFWACPRDSFPLHFTRGVPLRVVYLESRPDHVPGVRRRAISRDTHGARRKDEARSSSSMCLIRAPQPVRVARMPPFAFTRYAS